MSATDHPRPAPVPDIGGRAVRPSLDTAIASTLGVALLLLGFLTTGGFDGSVSISAANTWTEIVLILLGAGVVCAPIVLGARGPAWGATAVALFARADRADRALDHVVRPARRLLAGRQPDPGLPDDLRGRRGPGPDRTGALALTRRRAGGGHRPAQRLRAPGQGLPQLPRRRPTPRAASRLPLGYWNATGALAAMGIGPCLWGFTRPDGSRGARGAWPCRVAPCSPPSSSCPSRAPPWPSRSCILAAWLILAPGRLRGVLLIALSAVGAAVICAWALAHSALSHRRRHAGRPDERRAHVRDRGAARRARRDRGRRGRRPRRRRGQARRAAPPTDRHRPGRTGRAAARGRGRGSGGVLPGLTGEISHAWSSLTSVNAKVGESASRITQFGSSRPLYWSQGITVGSTPCSRVSALWATPPRALSTPRASRPSATPTAT